MPNVRPVCSVCRLCEEGEGCQMCGAALTADQLGLATDWEGRLHALEDKQEGQE